MVRTGTGRPRKLKGLRAETSKKRKSVEKSWGLVSSEGRDTEIHLENFYPHSCPLLGSRNPQATQTELRGTRPGSAAMLAPGQPKGAKPAGLRGSQGLSRVSLGERKPRGPRLGLKTTGTATTTGMLGDDRNSLGCH